jgi:hypothetical protein
MEAGPRRTTFSLYEHSTALKVEIFAVLSCARERANLYFSDHPGSIASASGTKDSVDAGLGLSADPVLSGSRNASLIMHRRVRIPPP